jgi:hypothetical protein
MTIIQATTCVRLQPPLCNHVTKLCRQQAEIVRNHGTENVRIIGQGKARHIRYV